jgi:hypothetical protein
LSTQKGRNESSPLKEGCGKNDEMSGDRIVLDAQMTGCGKYGAGHGNDAQMTGCGKYGAGHGNDAQMTGCGKCGAGHGNDAQMTWRGKCGASYGNDAQVTGRGKCGAGHGNDAQMPGRGKCGAGYRNDAQISGCQEPGACGRYCCVSKAGYCKSGGESKNGKELHIRGLQESLCVSCIVYVIRTLAEAVDQRYNFGGI